MPYEIVKARDGFVVKKKLTGEVVAHSKTLAGAKGYAWHAENADTKKPQKKG